MRCKGAHRVLPLPEPPGGPLVIPVLPCDVCGVLCAKGLFEEPSTYGTIY